ncbi:hypothetical protein like AT2G26730 [Hibiscus trionum]|uniref:Protein kinase domain-containing protein n=1 Tax=Hibiscus trionum TaxID=183268 RepID=A0A9W7GZM5_HIBTR|nr:hypothetical protein like AT2G26730 [Hibiscus trionum]
MEKISIWLLFVPLFLVIHVADSVDDAARDSLVTFFTGLSNNNGSPDPNIGWNSSSDPCRDKWKGVDCDTKTNSLVKKIVFYNSGLSGFLNATALCNVGSIAASLNLLNLSLNSIGGEIQADIANCKQLTRLFLGGNQFTGKLPDSMAMLGNLIQLDISNNRFGGDLPGLGRISGLQMFLAQNNQLTGEIPDFDFSNLDQFNVSNNNFQGPIPDVNHKFPANCYLDNPGLCGEILQKTCPPSKKKSKGLSNKDILMFSGYIALGLVIVGLIVFRLTRKKVQSVDAPAPSPNKVASVDDFADTKPSFTSAELKTDVSKSEFSINSTESVMVSSSLVVLTSPTVSDLKFEDLLRAPAELLGRGKHGTLYRVIFENGMVLAVKRIKGWTISTDEFKQRMLRLDQSKHPNVLPPLAFYCSKHEKLLVYEYQLNGSLFTLLHGNRSGRRFEWASRLSVAAKIAEGLAFMHHELDGDGIPHGNLKSSNIMLKSNMEPCISEYGLMAMDPLEPSSMQQQTKDTATSGFKADIYGLGVILLELLTGKLVQNDGVDLTSWVQSVVREEWTVEVFDKALFSEGASEEEMLNLLQVAIKCANQAPESRPSINQVVTMINAIKEEEEKSLVHQP